MTKLTDELIAKLAHAECPKVYGHEAKAMAQEILEFRALAEAARKAASGNSGGLGSQGAAGQQVPMPWPYGGTFP